MGAALRGARHPRATENSKISNKDRRNRPHGDEFLLGSLSSKVPENRSVVSELPSSVARGLQARRRHGLQLEGQASQVLQRELRQPARRRHG